MVLDDHKRIGKRFIPPMLALEGLEVNVGSWAGLGTRQMAQEVGCEDLYNYAYQPFSAATHSMWHHVARYNLEVCDESLHKLHRVPVVLSFEPDVDYFYRAAKYVHRAFAEFDKTIVLPLETPSAYLWLRKQLFPDKPAMGERDEPLN